MSSADQKTSLSSTGQSEEKPLVEQNQQVGETSAQSMEATLAPASRCASDTTLASNNEKRQPTRRASSPVLPDLDLELASSEQSPKQPTACRETTTSTPLRNTSSTPINHPEASKSQLQSSKHESGTSRTPTEVGPTQQDPASPSCPTTKPSIADNSHLSRLLVPQTDLSCSANAVRVLFADNQDPDELRGPISGLNENPPSPATGATRLVYEERETSISVVSASRRLIERQIEAIQVADSRRWNFDFRNCRPLEQPGHRYVQYNTDSSSANPSTSATTTSTVRNCRPLHDRTLSTTNQQSPWRLPANRQTDRHHGRLSDPKYESE